MLIEALGFNENLVFREKFVSKDPFRTIWNSRGPDLLLGD